VRQRIHDRIFWFCALTVVFFLPLYGRIVPPVIILMTLNWLVQGSYLQTIPKFRREPWRIAVLSPSVFYLIYLAGYFHSADRVTALFDLEVKLSFLVFPVILSTSEFVFDQRRIQTITRLFVLVCLVNSLILFTRAILRWNETGRPDMFFYTHLSWMFHATYLSMYFAFSISILALELRRWWSSMGFRRRLVRLALIAWMMAFVVLLSSRAGILSVFLVIVLVSSTMIFTKGMLRTGLMVLLISSVYMSLLVRFLPYAMNRNDYRDAARVAAGQAPAATPSSTTDRIGILKASLRIAGDHWLFGTGIGDVGEELNAQYQAMGLEHARSLRLNAHNQYLQTMMATGIAGALALILMILLPMVRALRSRDWLFLSLLLLVGFNLLLESMFEAQAGVVFFAFLYGIFLTVSTRASLFK